MKQILLLHGAIGGADQLVPLKELLEDEFEVHVLEFDGHGGKASNKEKFSLESFEQQLGTALDKLNGQVHIFGYSMGGFVTLTRAAKDSEQIASLITLGTKMKWTEEIAQKEIKNLNPTVIKEKVPKFAQVLARRHGDQWEELLNRTTDFMLDLGHLQPINKATAKHVELPVLLCLADQDHMVSMEETQEVKEWIAGSKLEIIQESKHPIEQVNLMALASTIKSFIQSLD